MNQSGIRQNNAEIFKPQGREMKWNKAGSTTTIQGRNLWCRCTTVSLQVFSSFVLHCRRSEVSQVPSAIAAPLIVDGYWITDGLWGSNNEVCVQKGNKAWTNNGQFVLCPSNVRRFWGREGVYLLGFARYSRFLYQNKGLRFPFIFFTRESSASVTYSLNNKHSIRLRGELCSS